MIKFSLRVFIILSFGWIVLPPTMAWALIKKTDIVKIESLYNKSKKDSERAWKVYAPQSFQMQFDKINTKKEFFVTFLEEDKITSSLVDYQFAIVDLNSLNIRYVLAKSKSSFTQIFSLKKIEAVGFKDINDDGKLDIFAIISYFDSRPIQGDGVGGDIITTGLSYVSNSEEYLLSEKCLDSKSVQKLQVCEKNNISANKNH